MKIYSQITRSLTKVQKDCSAFERDLQSVKWNQVLTLSKEKPNLSFKSSLATVNRFINKYFRKKAIPKTKNRKKTLNHE